MTTTTSPTEGKQKLQLPQVTISAKLSRTSTRNPSPKPQQSSQMAPLPTVVSGRDRPPHHHRSRLSERCSIRQSLFSVNSRHGAKDLSYILSKPRNEGRESVKCQTLNRSVNQTEDPLSCSPSLRHSPSPMPEGDSPSIRSLDQPIPVGSRASIGGSVLRDAKLTELHVFLIRIRYSLG